MFTDSRTLPQKRRLPRILWPTLVGLCLLALSSAQGQISERISGVTLGIANEGEPLFIRVELARADIVEGIELAYRRFGESSFRFMEMPIIGNTASATLPGYAVVPPFVEYYFVLHLRGLPQPETYPLENAAQQPLKVGVRSAAPREARLVLLSPEEGERLRPDEVLISFSLINFDSTLDRTRIALSIDGTDHSALAVLSGDLVVLKPENVAEGRHTFVIELVDLQGRMVDKVSQEFVVASAAPARQAEEPSRWQYSSTLQLETRNEQIASASTQYTRATLGFAGRRDEIRLHGRLYLTNEEEEARQPQNRFFLGGELPWLKLGYGDQYPLFPDLILSGKRVRGFSGNLTLGFFNLDLSEGEIVRSVEGTLLKTFARESLLVEQQRDPGGSFDSLHSAPFWAKLRYGTLKRTLFVLRPSFGRRDGPHIGFTYLKSTDDLSSIRYGAIPQENLVLASDIAFTIDRRNIEFTGQAAVSATNRDITKGTFSDAEIDATFSEYSDGSRRNIRQIRDILSKFITVNENLVPLNARNMPTFSYEANLFVNYFDNNLKFSVLRHGESFESFGQPYLRQDVAGLSISDRLRLEGNQVVLSGGFERLNDNTAETKASTTTGTTVNLGVSYYPLTEAPSLTVAYLHASNANGRPLTDSLYAVDDGTDRIMLQMGKEFTYVARHSASIGVSVSSRDDHTFRDLDTRNTAVVLTNSSRFPFPLQTTVSLSVNASKFFAATGAQTLGYTTLNASAGYRMLEGRFLLNGAVSPTFGDIERVLASAGGQYFFLPNVSVQSDLSLYFNSKLFGSTQPANDVVWSLIIRADL